MNTRVRSRVLLALALAPIWACQVENPAQPSVTFMAPRGLGPADGAVYAFTAQPITLTIVNTVRAGDPTVTYTVEVARDNGFQNIAFSRGGVPEVATGTTDVQIDKLPGDTTYYWRWMAVIDDVTGQPSATQHFFIQPEIIIGAPGIVSPESGSTVFTARPTFTVLNSNTSGPVTTMQYTFEVSESSSFTSPVASQTVNQQSGARTSWTPSTELPEGMLYWRARGVESPTGITGPYSETASFERKFGIDLNQVIYIESPNIANWGETSQITSAFHSDGQLCVEHTKLGQWPATDFFGVGPILEGNQFVFALIDGKWYGGAADWYRPGQACKGVDENIGPDSFRTSPLSGWRPRPGEVFGIAATTPSRLYPGFKTLDQRTDIWLIVW